MLAFFDNVLFQIVLLLATTVFVVLLFQRLKIPSSLAYLAVGVLLGSHTAGPVIRGDYIGLIAEFGIVFLLFTIGLNFTVAQIYALRHTIFGLGTGQVVLTTAVVGLGGWALGLPAAAAFVVGAVFAQSSTTIISRQLSEQGESDTRHGRLGTAMSVFQDVTAVPFVIIIPVLGLAAATEVAGSLAIALVKAALAAVGILLAGRFLLRRFFHSVAESRSAELFTLTVLFVSLTAAGITGAVGLSMAFGAFLAGMVLGETEFRHQVEATVRPFRDVLLGLFFVSIGMLFQPALLPLVWFEALVGALVLMSVKLVLVTALVRWSGVDAPTAFRTGLLLSVGGEFGFALLALGFGAGLLDERTGQAVLTAVLLSMVAAPVLIRFNQPLSAWLVRSRQHEQLADSGGGSLPEGAEGHVIICGFGRTGQMIARFLENEEIPYLALDIDPRIVSEASLAGQPVYYADSTDPAVLETVGLRAARLLVVSHNERTVALKTLACVRQARQDVPVLVRARDEGEADELRKAGAAEVIPETLEAGMTIASHALMALGIPMRKVTRYVLEQRAARYPMLRELFRGTEDLLVQGPEVERLHAVRVEEGVFAIGRHVSELSQSGCMVTAIVRGEERIRYPEPDTPIQVGDVLVLLGVPDALADAERWMTGRP